MALLFKEKPRFRMRVTGRDCLLCICRDFTRIALCFERGLYNKLELFRVEH